MAGIVPEGSSTGWERRVGDCAVTAACWTLAGICAHEFPWAGEREVIVPVMG